LTERTCNATTLLVIIVSHHTDNTIDRLAGRAGGRTRIWFILAKTVRVRCATLVVYCLLFPTTAKMATDAAAKARPKREAKAVEHFTIETKEVDPDDLAIKAGAGSKFGDVENIVFKIAKLNAQSDELKQLHRLCFGKPGVKTMIKKNLREFSGFVADDMAAEKAKKLAMVLKHDLKVIKGMLDTCDLSPGGTKAEAAARLIDFLEAPHESGKKSLAEKAGQKRKAAEKKVRHRA